MQSKELRDLVIDALDEMKAKDITDLDVSQLTSIADYMVIATGTSSRHVKSLSDNVIEKAKTNHVQPLGVEGVDEGEWVLVDLGSVIVHIMQPQARDFYDLEQLWQITEAEVTEQFRQ